MQPVNAQIQRDFRLIVLLAVAVIICLQHLPSKKAAEESPALLPISWHEATSLKGQGLHFDDIDPLFSVQIPQNLPSYLAPIFFQPIPINIASHETLTIIPGIGRSLAQKIITFRLQEGLIKDAGDLLLIAGIGEKKAAIIVQYVSFSFKD